VSSAFVPSIGAGGGRATRPGPSGAKKAVVVGIFAVLLAVLGVGIYSLVSPARTNYSDPQSWLPPQQLDHPVDRTVVGTLAHPALTVEGDYVEVKTPQFRALALMVGPDVPGEGLTVQTRYTTCTWTISLTHVVGNVPIAVSDFDSIDHTGTVVKPALVPGQPTLPSVLTTGRDLTFRIRSVMPVGEGLLRWAPDGNNIVAKWDYQVEND
jgi:hypothetical protein